MNETKRKMQEVVGYIGCEEGEDVYREKKVKKKRKEKKECEGGRWQGREDEQGRLKKYKTLKAQSSVVHIYLLYKNLIHILHVYLFINPIGAHNYRKTSIILS